MTLSEYKGVLARLRKARDWRKGIDNRPMADVIPDIHQHGNDQDIAMNCLAWVIKMLPKMRKDCIDCSSFHSNKFCEKSCPHFQFFKAFDEDFLLNKKNGMNKNTTKKGTKKK